MSEQGVLREVYDDLRHEVVHRRVQLLAAVAYVVLVVGFLYLFSSIGEDSRTFSDVHRRTTLAAVGTGLLAVGSGLCVATLLFDRAVRRRGLLGRSLHLPNRRWLAIGAVLGSVLVSLGVVGLTRWT